MSLSVLGNPPSFTVKNSRWIPDGWDLDRLLVDYEGPYTDLTSFLATLTLWAASSIDGSMYLSDWSVDSDPRHPTVTLTYIGKKGGILPPARRTGDTSEQQAVFTSYTGKTTVSLTYNARVVTQRIFSRLPIDYTFVGAPAPASVASSLVWFVAHTDEGVTLPTTPDQAMAFFVEREINLGSVEELVPGQYFAATQVRRNQLFSIQA